MPVSAALFVAYTGQSMAGTLLAYSLYEVQSVGLISTLLLHVNHLASARKIDSKKIRNLKPQMLHCSRQRSPLHFQLDACINCFLSLILVKLNERRRLLAREKNVKTIVDFDTRTYIECDNKSCKLHVYYFYQSPNLLSLQLLFQKHLRSTFLM